VSVTYALSGPSGVAAGQQAGADAVCPAGTHVTGGGIYDQSEDTGVSINASYPFDGDGMTGGFVPDDGWEAFLNNESTEFVSFAVYAVCVSASSVNAPGAGAAGAAQGLTEQRP
jgi:hypothetical protein